jgi:uncharacterized membrane protein
MKQNHNQSRANRESGIPAHPERAAGAASVIAGAGTGAAIGFLTLAGPIGGLIGGVLGALAGGAIGEYVRQRSKREDAKDAILDREIGVTGGDIGAAPADSPPAPANTRAPRVESFRL